MLTVTSGINLNPSSLAQSGLVLKAAAEVAEGQGAYPAGCLLAINSDGDYVLLNPSAADGTEIPRAVALEGFNTRDESKQVQVGYWGVFTRSKVFIPKYKQETGDDTTKNFSVGEAIVDGTVTVFVDGELQAEGVHYNVNYEGGVISFVVAPAAGQQIDIYYGTEITEEVAQKAMRESLWFIRIVG